MEGRIGRVCWLPLSSVALDHPVASKNDYDVVGLWKRFEEGSTVGSTVGLFRPGLTVGRCVGLSDCAGDDIIGWVVVDDELDRVSFLPVPLIVA